MQNYFISHINYFWKWETEVFKPGEVNHIATIVDGQSIAYLKTILETLEDLEHQGLPPFGAVLLALIASNPNLQEASFNRIKGFLIKDNRSEDKTFTNAIVVLNHINNLPGNYKTGQNKTALFQTLFKDCHNRYGLKKSANIINYAKRSDIYAIGSEARIKYSESNLNQDIRPIALLIRRFKSPEDIIDAINNVPKSDLFDDIEIEGHLSPEIETNKTFLEQLTEHKSTYQIGSLVKRIWSGLNIPMHNNLPSNQPLGGVSDITNKGDFSRLLISEFAHDDDTFMSRIVNNEALYIERETPPETNNKHRVFLIDGSLRNWGIPKLLSFATTVAITSHPKSDFKYSAYVIGNDYEEAPIDSVLDIIESQHLLAGTLHCAKGLNAFLKDNGDDEFRELFLLTEEKNLENSDFQNAIFNNYNAINYIITTTTNGDINFYKHQNRTRKHFQHILLPYQDIWNNHLPKSTVKRHLKNNDLNIDHLLLEPIDKSNCVIIPFEDEIYIIQNKNIYSLTSKGISKGLQLIHENVPNSNEAQYTIVKNIEKQHILIYFSKLNKEVSRLNLKTKEITTKQLNFTEFKNSTVQLFSWKNNMVLSCNKEFYNIPNNDSKLYKLDGTGNAYSRSLLDYQEKINTFRRQLKGYRISYNLLKNIGSIEIEYQNTENMYLDIFGFILEGEKIIPEAKSKYHYSYNTFDYQVPFTPKTTLYLKRVGKNPLSVIKYLKETFSLSLIEAKQIADNAPEVIINQSNQEIAEEFKEKLEILGATCYIKTDYFESKDGSTIHIKNGQLIFKSSNEKIPQFYITSLLNFSIAMASKGEFAGNSYFLPVNHKLTTIDIKDFYQKYINPFMIFIIENED